MMTITLNMYIRGRYAARTLACLAIAMACPATGQATNYFWNNSTGGLFTGSLNWSPLLPLGPGDADDTVNFNRGVTPGNRYAVTNVNGENDRLLVHNDSLSLTIGEYALLNTSPDDASLIVGLASGDAGNVTFLGGEDHVLRAKHSSIGHAAGSMGTVNLNGPEWRNSDTLSIGKSGSGTLLIRNGELSNRDGLIGEMAGSTGTVTVDGADVRWHSNGKLHVGSGGNGTLTVQAGETSSNFASIANLAGSVGTVTVTGNDSSWFIGTELSVGEGGQGSLTINGGGAVSSAHAFVGRLPGSGGLVNMNGTGSNWEIRQRLSIGGDAVAGANGGIGTLNIASGGTVDVREDTVLFPNGLLRLQGGTLATTAISFQGGGQFNWTAGKLHVGTFNGDLVNSAGTLAPGRSAGTATIQGDYHQQSAATLEIEIGGIGAGITHDLVNVTGMAILSGQLRLSLLNDSAPGPADSFNVFGALGGILGAFSNVATGQRLTTTDGTGSFAVHYGLGSTFSPNQIRLTDFQLAGLPGDYNEDGIVNAADYVVWRNNEGTMNALPNDPLGGTIGAAQYDQWRANFGNTPGSGSNIAHSAFRTPHSTSVPEPIGVVLVLNGAVGLAGLRRRG